MICDEKRLAGCRGGNRRVSFRHTRAHPLRAQPGSAVMPPAHHAADAPLLHLPAPSPWRLPQSVGVSRDVPLGRRRAASFRVRPVEGNREPPHPPAAGAIRRFIRRARLPRRVVEGERHRPARASAAHRAGGIPGAVRETFYPSLQSPPGRPGHRTARTCASALPWRHRAGRLFALCYTPAAVRTRCRRARWQSSGMRTSTGGRRQERC
jgi:hypothetical protein